MSDDLHAARTPAAPEQADQADVLLESPRAVVGIGGSAGALDGYERFFLSLPRDTGMAFVVVSHLGPNGESLMLDLLQRCTSLPVLTAQDGMPLQADHVYVIPPGQRFTLQSGVLRCHVNAAGGASTSVDAFLESLASDQGQRGVAVILSGAGSDGARGVRAMKEYLGLVLVQDPDTADYPGMPASAIATGLVDQVLPAEELAPHLYQLITHERLLPDTPGQDADLQKILLLVRSRTGQDFTRYKRGTLERRVVRRMKNYGLHTLAQYLQYLQRDTQEVNALFEDLTINVTSFFRDPEAYASLKSHLRTYLKEHKQDGEPVRVWVVGCASGEEAYSIVMVVHELMQENDTPAQMGIQVFATDIDPRSIEKARYGVYSRSIEDHVSPERLRQYFTVTPDGYQIRSDLRELVVFALHNTFGDPPFTRVDLLCCRNMMIYLNSDLQKQILAVFQYALQPDGLLFLGASETPGLDGDRFRTVDARWKIYSRAPGASRVLPASNAFTRGDVTALTGGRPAPHPRSNQVRDVQQHAQRVLLARYAPPAVVVNEHGDILFVNGRTGRYLELTPGPAGTNNILDMAHDGLRYELASALRQAAREHRDVSMRDVHFRAPQEGVMLDVNVTPLHAPGEEGRLLVVFQERPSEEVVPVVPPEKVDQVQALQRELQHVREALQATIEQLLISNEELRSTNEEYQTTIEELKSTNEELLTSKEELQSLNEELITTNAEHQRMIHDLGQAHDDMKNLLESAGIATLFLGNDLRIKRFTPRISSVVNLIPTDVGRHIGDISVKLRDVHFEQVARHVIGTLLPLEAQVQSQGGHWYLMRINPYRTSDNFIDGVVATFTNIDKVKALEGRLDQSVLYSEALLNSIAMPTIVFDDDLHVLNANKALHDLLRISAAQCAGVELHELGSRQLDQPELRRKLAEMVLTDQPLSNYVIDLDVPGVGVQKTKIEAWPVVSADGQTAVHLMLLENITPVVEAASHDGADFTGDASEKLAES